MQSQSTFQRGTLSKCPTRVTPEASIAIALKWATVFSMIDKPKMINGQRVFIRSISSTLGYAMAKLRKLQGIAVYATILELSHQALRGKWATSFIRTSKGTGTQSRSHHLDASSPERLGVIYLILARREARYWSGLGQEQHISRHYCKLMYLILRISK
ncbi:hypothetical protein GGR58DRAFT_509245 [Xylaria digitata]|nr:hypothetical protein GGR58DRAFT_509245 [Xylaria digitata]